jgi:nucleotide-binding universal stress UspA family protein
MYHVLVPVDANEERALTQADYVADLPHAEDSVKASVFFVFDHSADDLPDELERFNSATRVGAVRRATERLEEHDVEVDLVEESGDADTRILEAIEEMDPDAIVMGGRKRSSVGKALFGSVTQTVMLDTAYPVVVTGNPGT